MMRCGERGDSAFDRTTVVTGEVSFEVFGDERIEGRDDAPIDLKRERCCCCGVDRELLRRASS